MVDGSGSPGSGAGEDGRIPDAGGGRLTRIEAAMVLGVLPLIRATGAGAVSRYNMGLVIATGLAIGTLFTLFVVPVAYSLTSRKKHAEVGTSAAPQTP